MCSLWHSGYGRHARAWRAANWRRRLAVLSALLVPLLAAGLEDEKMNIMLSSPESKDYVSLETKTRPLTQGEPGAFAPPLPTASAGYYASCANNERNGRVGITLPDGEWTLAWERELRRGQLPQAVLSAGDRVVVHSGVWQLFDTAGTLLKEGSSGFGTVSLDPDRGLFYSVNRDGDIVARTLTDGGQVFALMPFLSEEFARPLIQRYAERLLVIGIERQLDPHGHHKASRSLMEWTDLGGGTEVSASGLLLSAQNAGTLILPTTVFLSAANERSAVCASSGRLYISAPGPTLESVFEGEFEPLRLSLGGNDTIYLVVLSGDELYLWCVSMEGRILMRFPFPEGAGSAIIPPVIGPDGRIFIVTASRVMALGAKGELQWEWKSDSTLAGATCTAGGSLIVTSEREVGILSEKGEYHRIHRSVDTPYVTAPCLTEKGMIVVASPGMVQAFNCP